MLAACYPTTGADVGKIGLRELDLPQPRRALTVLPLHRFPLAQTEAAHDAVEAGVVGKVLIDIPE